MNDKGQQFYEYLKSINIEVPASYEEFQSAMQDQATADQFYEFVKSQNVEVPETSAEFSSVFTSSGGADMGFTEGSQEPQEQPTKPFQENGKTPYDIRTASVQLEGEEAPSTVLMSSGEVDGKFVAFPTLFPKDPNNQTSNPKDWIQPEGWSAYDEAVKRGEVWEFDTEEEAARFAEGGWKNRPTKPSQENGAYNAPLTEQEQAIDKQVQEILASKPDFIKKKTEQEKIWDANPLEYFAPKKPTEEGTLRSMIEKSVGQIPEDQKMSQEELSQATQFFLDNRAAIDAADMEQRIANLKPEEISGLSKFDKEINAMIEKGFPLMANDEEFKNKLRVELIRDPERQARYRQGLWTLPGQPEKMMEDEEAFLITSQYLRDKNKQLLAQIQEQKPPQNLTEYIQAEKLKTDLVNNYEKYKELTTQNKAIIEKIKSDQEVVEDLNKGGTVNSNKDFVSRALNSLNNVATDLITLPATIAASMEDATGRGQLYTISDRILDYADKTYKNPLLVSERQFYNEQTGEFDLGAALLGAADQVGIIAALAMGNAYGAAEAAASVEGRLLTSFTKDALKAQSQNAYTIAGGYAASLEANRRDAKDMGLEGGDAFAYTQFMSFLEGTTELIMPDNQIFSKEVKDIALKTFAANLSNGKRFAAQEALKSIGEIIGKENLEEILVLAGKTVQTGAIALNNEDVETVVPTLGEVINTVGTTTASMLIPSAISNAGKRKQIENQMIIKSLNDIEGSKAVVDQFVDKGVVKKEDADAFKRKLDLAYIASEEIPTNFNEKQASEVLDPAIELVNLREQAKNKKGVAKELIDDDIRNLEEQIRLKAEEVKAQPVQEVTPTETVNVEQTTQEVNDYINNVVTATEEQVFGGRQIVDETLGKINNTEYISDTEIDNGIESVFNEIDRVNNLNISEQAKKNITDKLYNIAEQLDNYEFRTKAETRTTTKREAVTTPIKTPKTAVRVEEFFGGTPAEINGEIVKLSTADGRVVAPTSTGDVVIDTPTLDLKEDGVELDENGTFKSATFTDRLGNEIKFTGDTGLDLAIKARENKIGTVPEAMFIDLYNEVTSTEEVQVPYIKERKDAIQEQTAGQVPVQPEAGVSETMEGGKPQPKSEEATKADQEKTEEVSPLDKLREKFGKTTPARLQKAIDRALKALSKIAPEIKIVIAATDADFAILDGDRGAYENGVIYIHPEKANARTVAHEVFHALLLRDGKTDAEAKRITDKMMETIRKTASPELVRKLDEFASMYDSPLQSEESIAELFGMIAEAYGTMDSQAKSAIRQWLDELIKILGLDNLLGSTLNQSDKDIIEFLSTVAKKVAVGEEILLGDVNILDIEQGQEGETGNISKSIKRKSKVPAPSVKQDTRSFARFIEDKSLEDFIGENFITNMYDYTTAGQVDLGNGITIQLFGGKNYVPYMMELRGLNLGDLSNLAAFNTKENAQGFVRNAIRSGASLFMPHAGTRNQSWQFQHTIFEELTKTVIEQNILTGKELIEIFNQGLKNKKGDYIESFQIFRKNYGNISDLSEFKNKPLDLVRLLDIENNLSPKLRKRLSDLLIANEKFQKAIGIKNKEEFYDKIEDPLNKGVTGGELMGIIKFDPTTFSIRKTNPNDIDHHPSFGWTLEAKIEGIYQPTDFYKSFDVTDSYTKYNKNEVIVSTKENVTTLKKYKKALEDTRVFEIDKDGKSKVVSGKAPYKGTFEEFQKEQYKIANVSSSAGATPKVAQVTNLGRKQRIDKASAKLKGLFDRDNVPLSIEEAKEMVGEVYDWTTWYDGLSSYVNDLFGEYGEDVLSILPLSSMAANSSATVGMAINNVERIYKGEKPAGVAEYYGYVTDFLEGKGIKSDKMYNFFKALSGDKDAIAVDMHVYSIIMGKDPNKKQVNPANQKEFDKAKEFVNTLAQELGLAPREVQAALWALNILRTGGKPDSYEQYFENQVKTKKLKERIQGWREQGYKPFSELRKTREKELGTIRKQQPARPSIQEVKDFAKENGIGKADVKEYLKELGYTAAEIRKAYPREIKAPSARRITGQPKPKKVTVQEMAALKSQIRLEARAARGAVKAIKEIRAQIQAALESMVKSGKISSKQLNSILRKLNRMNLLNPDMRERFINYMEKVYNNADYIEKISQANSARTKIKKLAKSKTVDAVVAESAKLFAKVDPQMVENIDEYNKIAEEVLSGLRKTTFNAANVADYANTQIEIQDKINLERVRKAFEEVTGIDAKDLTYDQMMALIDVEDNAKELETKAKEVRTAAEKYFNLYSSVVDEILKGTDPFTGEAVELDEYQADLVRRLINLDLDTLNTKELATATRMLMGFVENGRVGGIEKLVQNKEGAQKAKTTRPRIIKTLTVLGSKLAGRVEALRVTSLPILFEKKFGGFLEGQRIQRAMGFTDLTKAANTVKKIVDTTIIKYYDKFGKTKPNGDVFNSLENNIERGIYAAMKRTYNGSETEQKAEFERKKGLIKDAIEELKQGDEKQIAAAEVYEKLYNSIVKDAESIKDIESKIDPINKQAVEYWIDEFAKIKEDLDDVSLSMYNTILENDLFYTPDVYKSVDKTEGIVEDKDSGFFNLSGKQVIAPGKAGQLKQINRPTKLKDRYISLDFDTNMVNAFNAGLMDIYTAPHISFIKGFMNSTEGRKLFGSKEDYRIFVERINNYIQAKRGQTRFNNKDVGKIMNFVAKIGAARALGSLTQPIKQVAPVAINTMINAGPQSFGEAVKLIYNNSAVNDFIDKSGYAIANRGASARMSIESLDKQLENKIKASKGKFDFVGALSESLIDKVLVKPDVAIARASWVAYYLQNLKKQGIEVDNINWETHKINDQAAEFAQGMVDRQQNISDEDLQGTLFTDTTTAKRFIRATLFPFSTFILNQKERMYSDIMALSPMSTATKEDRIIAARSLVGLIGEISSFTAIRAALGYLMYSASAALIGHYESDDDEERRIKNLIKGANTNFVSDLFSPLPAITDAAVMEVANLISNKLDGEDVVFTPRKKNFEDSFGTLGIVLSKARETGDLLDMAVDGKYTKEQFGKEIDIELTPEQQTQAQLAATLLILHDLGLPTEFGTVGRDIGKMVKIEAQGKEGDGNKYTRTKPIVQKSKTKTIKRKLTR